MIGLGKQVGVIDPGALLPTAVIAGRMLLARPARLLDNRDELALQCRVNDVSRSAAICWANLFVPQIVASPSELTNYERLVAL